MIALAAGIYGCGGLTLPGDATPAHIDMVTGDKQAGIVGTALPLPLVVKVTDELGRPVANQNVDFTVQSGGGQLSTARVATGTDGRASTTWTLGPNAGPQQVQAAAVGGDAPANLARLFDATAVAGSGSLIAAVSGDDQSAPVNSALTDSLVVRVSDGSNNPVSGITIQWTAVGGGSVSPETVVTGADGRAATARVLGPTSGQQSAQASSDGLAGSPVTFVQTALASNPTALTADSGNGQTAPAGFEVAANLVVRLTDANDNGVGGVAVTWVVATGGGTVSPQNTTTDPNGFAHTRWTLGPIAGQNTLTAVSGTLLAPFTATASADVPSKIALQGGNNQSAVGGQALASPLAVKVTDANDNPVENVSVAWTANGGGSVSSPTSATNAQGIAQITRTLGLTPGTYTTTADVPSLTGTPITFTSTATVGQAAKIVVTTQPGGTAANGVTLNPQPVVQVQDAAGNNVGPAGRTITADLINSPVGGSLNGDKTKDTDAGGQAVYTDLNITGPVGSYTIRFRSGSLTAAQSTTVSVTAGAPSAAASTVDASPTSVAAGDPSTITVIAKDAGGNPVSGVTVALQAGGSGNTLTQPGSPTDANGQTTGTFSSTSTGSHTITATLNGSITVQDNAAVTVTSGPVSASQSTVTGPATVGAGASATITVTARDAGNNLIAGATVVLAVTGSNNTIVQPGATNGSGVAIGSFSSSTVESKTVSATINGTLINATATVNVTPGAPSQIAITTQPSGTAQAGVAFATQPVVQLKDAGGNNSASSGVLITATIASGPSGGSLASATATTDGNGAATFSGLAINGQVGDYTLSFDSGSLTGATSTTITVSAGGATTLTFTQQPPDASSGAVITPAVVVSVADQFGNPAVATVHLALNVPVLADGNLSGTVDVPSSGGSTMFSDLSVAQTTNALSLPYTLSASASGISPVTSAGFQIN